MSGKTVHLSLSVRGALKWPARMKKGLYRDKETGRPCTANEATDFLLEALSEGIEVLPMGNCEGHDPKTGCPGHPTTEAQP